MAVLRVNTVTVNMLLSLFFVPGVLAACPRDAHLFITAPQQMEALSGSCLQIPCNFSATSEKLDSSKRTFGLWIKSNPNFATNPTNVIFNSSEPVNTYPMNMTGNLSQADCTTLFSSLITNYTDTYYFRVENKPTAATAICNPLKITIRDFPRRPSINISGDLKEKESVTITCSAVTPCPHSPPQLTWTLQQDSHNNIQKNTDGTFTTQIQETITLSDQNDGYNISCSARYPVNQGKEFKTAEETKTLSVSYAPKNTSVSISPSGLVLASSWVNLTCSSRAKPPANFTWFRNSTDGLTPVSDEQVYGFNITKGGVYFCVATNELGNQTSSVIDFNKKEQPNRSLPWGAVLGGIIGIIMLMAVCVCIVMVTRNRKSTDSTQQQNQSRATSTVSSVEDQARKTEEAEENIHYGEIDFSRERPKPSSGSEEHQDTLYAQIKVSNTPNRLTQTADRPEDLYAQVKRK